MQIRDKPSFSTQPTIKFPLKPRDCSSWKGRNKETFRYKSPNPSSLMLER
uniref:Uncharacterized protein n=1 Tax=Populus trichocarpa TaxID=3694 RepID=A0A2K1ZXM9_POPTR